ELASKAGLDDVLLQLDSTPQKTRLGANALLAVSLAFARSRAQLIEFPLYKVLSFDLHDMRLALGHDAMYQEPRLPPPMTNMISGGKHAGGNLDIQDVLIIPRGAADYPTRLEWIVRVYRRLSRILMDAGYEGYLVGDEGGYGPRLKSNREAISLVI